MMMMMKLRWNSYKYLRRTIVVTVALLFINVAIFSLRCCQRKSIRDDDQASHTPPIAAANATRTPHPPLDLPVPLPRDIAYRNTHWQVHSKVTACSELPKNATYKECSSKKNDNKTSRGVVDELIVYSAFYDDRWTPNGSRWVQVLGLVRIVSKPKSVVCQVWLRENSTAVGDVVREAREDKKKPMLMRVRSRSSAFKSHDGPTPTWLVEVPALVYTTGRNHNFPDLSYGQRQFACPLSGVPASLSPVGVSLTFEKGERSTIYLPVLHPTNGVEGITGGEPSYEHQFVICVTQAYGHVHAWELLEWLEMHRLLGVTRINIYNGTVAPDAELHSVLKFYEDEGLLTLRQIPPAVLGQPDKFKVEATKLSSPASLNDCMMRHVKSARWVIVVDFDEVILPVTAPDYRALMAQLAEMEQEMRPPEKVVPRRLSRTSTFNATTTTAEIVTSSPLVVGEGRTDGNLQHTYSFQMAYFFRNSSASSRRSNSSLFTVRYNRRTRPMGLSFSPKSFIDPRFCLSVFNHFCLVPHGGQGHKRYFVEPEVALVRHYRKSCSLKERCAALEKESIHDGSMERFGERLNERVEEAKRRILK